MTRARHTVRTPDIRCHSQASHYCHQLTFTDGLLVFAEHVIQGVDGGGEHHEAAGDQQPQGDQGRPGISRSLHTIIECGVNRQIEISEAFQKQTK